MWGQAQETESLLLYPLSYEGSGQAQVYRGLHRRPPLTTRQ